MAEQNGADREVSLKESLNLPRTDFPIRPQAKIDDPALLARWQQDGLYAKAFSLHTGAKKYILHDGPPYANGHSHLGHAYNRILKDILTKAYRMSGYHVPVTPGWDCHGLPIEHKVVQQQPGLTPLEIKQACRAYAQGWIDIQREEFKKLGVVMDWDRPYITMDHAYEASIMRAFGIILKKGLIERKNKTVAWCFSCQTTLASAEIEYQERKDPSLYVLFQLTEESKRALFPAYAAEPISMLIWTTTPWTLPLNRAVAVKPETSYQLVRMGADLVVVGAQRSAALATLFEREYTVLETFASDRFTGAFAEHPVVAGVTVPVLFDESVGVEEGTACVHIAPGCGPTDYELGVKNSLEIYSPITPDGRYAAAIVPQDLAGMSVTDGQIWVIKYLAAQGRLFHKGSLRHSYPHCWRCHNGLIFRATPQWFFDLKQVKEQALAAIDAITFVPEQGKSFMRATVGSRWEWCLSRQRSWGVPIPALLCTRCHTEYTSPEFVAAVAQGVAREGIEYWDRVAVADLVPQGLSCRACGHQEFRKESDILDVWFDSGVSHYAVLSERPELGFPADLYLEGLDQYRGWYQSSLLTSLVLAGKPAMRGIMCHGFTVDSQGRKMSKSLGNVVVAEEIIDVLGTDGLRLWVASIGQHSDVVVSDALLKNVGEVYRKIRNTSRFLLQNLYDFSFDSDAVPVEKLLYIDRIALVQLAAFNEAMQQEYRAGNFTSLFHGLADYCTTQLSALYLDIIKDRLYVEQADGHARRSAQTVCWYLLDTLTRLTAPILSFTAELLSDAYQKNKQDSIHLQQFADLSPLVGDVAGVKASVDHEWRALLDIRSAVLKALEVQREAGVIKHSLEAAVTIHMGAAYQGLSGYQAAVAELARRGQSVEDFFKEFFIVSGVTVITDFSGPEPLVVTATKAAGTKCPRCWNWQITDQHEGLCARCEPIVAAFRAKRS